MAADRPNILLLMTDQQRYDSLGCYGFSAGHTPNLDRLAAEGAVFEHCYVNSTICTPSRASLFTGKHLPGHGVYRLHDVLPSEELLVSRRLQQLGYTTALFGKLHVSGRAYEAKHRHRNDGFDVYEWCMDPRLYWDSPLNAYTRWLHQVHPDGYKHMQESRARSRHVCREHHMTHWAAERTIDFIRGSDPRRPFFCVMSIFDPHDPYDDHPYEMRALVDADEIPDPVAMAGDADRMPTAICRERQRQGRARGSLAPSDVREMRLGYHASIALADLEMGRVLEALEEKGIACQTMVVFVSDHGDMLGDHGLFTKGAFFYDPCVRVPLIIRWPERIPAGRRVRALVQPHDLAATMLAAAGMAGRDVARIMPESHDLIPAASGSEEVVRDYAICCYRNSGYGDGQVYFDPPVHATMIRDTRYKLSVFHDGSGECREGECLLHDMDEDPLELNNLSQSASHQRVKVTLLQRLLEWEVGQELRMGSRGGEAPTRPMQ